MTFEQFVDDVTTWQHRTFPDSTKQSVLSHLAEEAVELQRDQTAEEAADVLLLLIAFADKAGFDLLEAAKRKMEINRERRWTIKAQGGHTKHQVHPDADWDAIAAAFSGVDAEAYVTAVRGEGKYTMPDGRVIE